MADLPSDIDRINALTTNARNTWFVLLGALVFVSITLLDVEHIDFYGVDRATDLPLVSVSVPTRYFFYAAPLLIAAIFGYFHLYLIRLWDAVSVAEPRHEDRPLGDVITPWLVTDAALYLRARLRGDKSATHRILEGSAMLLNVLLAWAFGLGVLGWLWWASMPARDVWMTGLGAVALSVSLFAGAASFAMMVIRMRERTDGAQVNIFGSAPAMGAVLVAIPLIFILTEQRTMGENPDMLAKIEMLNENIVERPPGWLPHATAREEYRDAWCARKGKTCADLSDDEETTLNQEWVTRRAIALRDLRRPDWLRESSSHRPTDLRGANLRRAFIAGAYLHGAQMEGANLFAAQMEGVNLADARMERVNLIDAQMERANLFGAQMKGASLSGAQLERANLSAAQMEGADLFAAQMEGANLRGAQMEGAVLRGAQMEGAVLRGAQMEGADLSGAQMERAVLYGAQMEGAVLRGAQMEGADLRWTKMEGAFLVRAQMKSANLFEARMESANLRGAQMKSANLRGALMEGAVLLGANLEGTDIRGAQMEGAHLGYSRIFGLTDRPSLLTATNLSASTNNGGALRFVDMSDAVWNEKTDFRNAFLDGSVVLPSGFAARMGGDLPRPCQWIQERLSDDEFFAVWRWWLESNNRKFWPRDPPEYLNVPLPTSERLAEFGLADCSRNNKWGPMPDMK